MRASGFVVRRKKSVIVVWAIVFLALAPLILGYGRFISYSVTPASLSDSESTRAQQLLSSLATSNSTLEVVFQPSKAETVGQIENTTISFQKALNSSGIPYCSGSSSVFSSYEKFLSEVLTKETVLAMSTTYSNFTGLAAKVYGFPSAFLGNWSGYGYSRSSIPQAAAEASYDGSGYESLFLTSLNATFSDYPGLSPAGRVQNATATAALKDLFPSDPFLIFPVVETDGYNVTNYRTGALGAVASYLTGYSGVHVSEQMVQSALVAGTNASAYYFAKYGLLGAPSYITQQYVSPDNSTYIVSVNFNVTEDYRGPGGFYPAQNATAEIRALAQKYFRSAGVTGQGAIAADTAQVSASAGYAFGLIFVSLAIAVGILFASYLPPVLVLIVVSLATALGYFSICITGLLGVRVDYVVTDVLTAVILGVSTDYFVFMLSRYREELRAGRPDTEALSIAASRAGFAIVVSGVTVAVSLGAISLVSGLESWGPVLSLTILLAVALETTLVPAVLGLVGPRVFAGARFTLRGAGGSLRPRGEPRRTRAAPESSPFYRAVRFSSRRKFLIVGVIAILAAPPAYLWFNLPTTYSINEGLPQGAPSVQALNIVDQKFGTNVIYPTFVVVSFDQNATAAGAGLTQAATASLESDARLLLETGGIKQVIGPTVNGTKVEPSSMDSYFTFNHGYNAYFVVFTDYDPYSSNAISVVSKLRQNGHFLVGGLTSSVIDLQAYYGAAFGQLELIILFVIAAILGISFRSVKYPLISLTGVFVSIVWTTAILYLFSRFVLGEELVFLIPIVLFVILMSLGNDFGVFIFSRVREEQKALGFGEGLARAMVGSGAVVTALGLILAVSLGSLGLVPFGYLEQLGAAFVVSLLLDTFVIRVLYFPSMLFILEGRRRDA